MARPRLIAKLVDVGLPTQRITTTLTGNDGMLRKFNIDNVANTYDIGTDITDFTAINALVDGNGKPVTKLRLATYAVDTIPTVLRNPGPYGSDEMMSWALYYVDDNGTLVSTLSDAHSSDPLLTYRTWVNRKHSLLTIPNLIIGLLNSFAMAHRSPRRFTMADVKSSPVSLVQLGVGRFSTAVGDETTLIGDRVLTSDIKVIRSYPNTTRTAVRGLVTRYFGLMRKHANYKLLVDAILNTSVTNVDIISNQYHDIAIDINSDLAVTTITPLDPTGVVNDSRSDLDFDSILISELDPTYGFKDLGNGTFDVLGRKVPARSLDIYKQALLAKRKIITNSNPFPFFREATAQEKIPLEAFVELPPRPANTSLIAPVDLGTVDYVNDTKSTDKKVVFRFSASQVAMMDGAGFTNPYLLAIPNAMPLNTNTKTTRQVPMLATAVKLSDVTADTFIEFKTSVTNAVWVSTMSEWGVTFYIVDSTWRGTAINPLRPISVLRSIAV